MGKKVKQYVYVQDPKTQATIILAPGDEVPSGVEVGDHVFEDPATDVLAPAPVAPPAPAAEDEEDDGDGIQDDLTDLSHAELDEIGNSMGLELKGTRSEKQAAIRDARS